MTWRVACNRADLPAERGWPVRVRGAAIALFQLDGQVLAVENRCLHVSNPLDDGFVEDGCVICPWHGWRFDLRTGEHLTMFGRRHGLRTYPVRTEGDYLLIDVDEGKESPSAAHRPDW